ncbi:hypothetical protein BH747_02805 [Enterococcus villorum]|uniref:Acyltransferase 3 domain-containing protein n=1 Tax=Enterococcus villorum TaxID=112904 RepID=A0A1V8YEF4_9ENTE|nr:acyltransferase [Enterococcus villorum]OQO70948.1 hypothetical protein BH747_02805 [Enterococcus villorum]OQO74864.1 hypothetical protein BH744_06715 [Enterococcus villorum]
MGKTKNITYELLDLIKFIAAICVVGIHTFPHDGTGNDIRIFFRFSVPLFFIISSYLLFSKLTYTDKKKDYFVIKRYSLRILTMYLCWLIFYSPYIINRLESIINQPDLFKNGLILLYSLVLGYVPSIGVSWFLMAIVLGVIVTYYVAMYLSDKFLIILGILSFGIGLATSTYGKWYFALTFIHKIPLATSVPFSLVSTICYIIIGYFLVKYNRFGRTFSNFTMIILSLLFSILGYLEVKFAQSLDFYYDSQNFIFLPFIAVCIFLFIINNPQIKIPYATFFRKASIIIYLAQNPIKFILFKFGQTNQIDLLSTDNVTVYITQCCLLLFISYLIIELSKYNQLRLLRKLS